MLTRRNFLTASAGLAGAGIGTTGYAVGVEPSWIKQTRWVPPLTNWTLSRPLRIVAIADIHMSPPFMTLGRLEDIVREANGLLPDIVVLLGDYAEGHGFGLSRSVPGDVARVLSGLEAPLGSWAVFGNHDWATGPAGLTSPSGLTVWHEAFDAAGINVLSNRAARLSHHGEPFWIGGLESQVVQRDDLDTTLEQMDDAAPAILLAHEPDIFPRVPDRISLTLSGHTHGGQVRLFGKAPVVPSRYGSRYAYGHVVENGRHLIVSAGLGCSRLPVRFGIPPELVIVDL